MELLLTIFLVLLLVALVLFLLRKVIGFAVGVGIVVLGVLIILHVALRADEFISKLPSSARSFLAVVDGPISALVGIFSYAVSLFA